MIGYLHVDNDTPKPLDPSENDTYDVIFFAAKFKVPITSIKTKLMDTLMPPERFWLFPGVCLPICLIFVFNFNRVLLS